MVRWHIWTPFCCCWILVKVAKFHSLLVNRVFCAKIRLGGESGRSEHDLLQPSFLLGQLGLRDYFLSDFDQHLIKFGIARLSVDIKHTVNPRLSTAAPDSIIFVQRLIEGRAFSNNNIFFLFLKLSKFASLTQNIIVLQTRVHSHNGKRRLVNVFYQVLVNRKEKDDDHFELNNIIYNEKKYRCIWQGNIHLFSTFIVLFILASNKCSILLIYVWCLFEGSKYSV